jgi:hypothetical protein
LQACLNCARNISITPIKQQIYRLFCLFVIKLSQKRRQIWQPSLITKSRTASKQNKVLQVSKSHIISRLSQLTDQVLYLRWRLSIMLRQNSLTQFATLPYQNKLYLYAISVVFCHFLHLNIETLNGLCLVRSWCVCRMISIWFD